MSNFKTFNDEVSVKWLELSQHQRLFVVDVSAEDMWNAYKVADSTTSGLISTNTSLSNKTKLQMAIVEHIFKVKVEEKDIAKKRAEAKDKLAILARAQEAKTIAAIEAMSPEQIEAEIAKLQAQL